MKLATLLILILMGFIAFFYPISAEVAGDKYTCDTCHNHANIYERHLEGGKYCSQCHGEIHALHSFSCEVCHVKKPLTILCHSAPSDAQILTIPTGKNAVCENCHINIVETHKGDCQSCHIDNINEIHIKANRR
ncbi:MAG: hypothetical protein RMH75_03770 [Archaeoglobaceae archaeon]|nr:hypothetical protein [Archaeoglobaceae archaeon]MDW7989771.1 hypothetical protein [Archaeoglobaceae archaeon]